MADYAAYYEARNIITDILRQDFVGPVRPDEILQELPAQYYIMGKLYPQNNRSEVLDLAQNPFLENEVESYDASISLSNQYNPSSIGVTCSIKAGIESLLVTGRYAFYEPVSFEDAPQAGIDTSKWNESEKKPLAFWRRREYNFARTLSCAGASVVTENLERGMQLQVYTHAILPGGERVLTVVLINENTSESTPEMTSQECAFQTEICISSAGAGSDVGVGETIFTNVGHKSMVSKDPELLELDMLYSDAHCYGQGHGCSVVWDEDHPSLLWVKSSFFPSYNLKQMMPAQFPGLKIMQMHYLATASDREILDQLSAFIERYHDWIENIKRDASELPDRLQHAAGENIKKCEKALARLHHAIALLDNDKTAMRAFKLANEAMYMQRYQTLRRSDKKVGQVSTENITWYPFQLAFILHELPSFIEPDGDDRKEVDLLWFPTGGGKTEAYLGITAFTIFLRRLHNKNDDGVTVIMRYTLRLLTLQQFERASMLIFACELLRKKYAMGGSEISIGLWVGGKLTPNTLADARASINKQKKGAMVGAGESNPCQVQVCPWCGTRLTPNDYSVDIADERMVIRCSNPECEFHSAENGLPAHIIDQAIYRHLPTFIVATVDKFAQIPLSDKPAALFGISSHRKPPELIIQDELHLISGPLGTMTGIYEAAISKLCEYQGIPAKVIASTATIRNAGNQIKALYCRGYTQFPSQGITAKDSFFAAESTEQDRPARQYLGVMGIGTSATTTLIRINAALVFAKRYLATLDYDDKIIDNFWTFTGYFNSLRELGGASTHILDEVQSRYSYLAKTKFAHMTHKIDPAEKSDKIVELTSRMNNSEITSVIQVYLKRNYRKESHNDVYDFVLASNMLSVGVDVGRLGVMTVEGQPKTNAEYIQATSRVGRDNPGLVVISYNASRSRDRSYYEQFLKYHSALYRYVEATSLTPFSDRARDRGLHALYVSLCRYLVPGMLENDCAIKFNPERSEVKKIKNMIIDYVERVDPNECDAVIRELEEIESVWQYRATGDLVYKSYGFLARSQGSRAKELLKNDTEDDPFRTMNSLRSVDVSSGIYLLGR